MRQSIWKHKTIPGKFSGHYERDSGDERIFVLKRREGGSAMRKVYESPTAAQNSGWKLLKAARPR